MKLSARSGLEAVAAAVAEAMVQAGIRAVLTGGACASLYSRGAYQSSDLDFVLQSAVTARALDEVMGSVGFRREGNHYRHPAAPFFVEFPAGPLGIGSDINIEPVRFRVGKVSVLALSATHSCLDRLASFLYHNDRQSLQTAVAIAKHRRVDMAEIRRWCKTEGALAAFDRFRALLPASRNTRVASRHVNASSGRASARAGGDGGRARRR